MSVPTTLQSNLVPFAISEDDVTYKNVLCKKAWNFQGTTAVTEEESDCGVHAGLGSNKATVQLDIILNTTPNTATEVSGKVMAAYWEAQTLLYLRLFYPVSTGADLYVKGQAYITSYNIINQVGSLINISMTMTFNSSPDMTP